MTEQELEQQQRQAVITEARAWIDTPYLPNARIKGAGADCETFLCEVFAAAGVFQAQGIPYIPSQWFLNTKEELYLKYLSRYATEYEFTPAPGAKVPQPGDIVCVKHRWVYSHGALVISWPMVMHCYPPRVSESNVFYNPAFASGEMKFFNPWNKPDKTTA